MPPYELDLRDFATAGACIIGGAVNDLRGTVRRAGNHLDPPDPDFDAEYRPRNALYAKAGYRPR